MMTRDDSPLNATVPRPRSHTTQASSVLQVLRAPPPASGSWAQDYNSALKQVLIFFVLRWMNEWPNELGGKLVRRSRLILVPLTWSQICVVFARARSLLRKSVCALVAAIASVSHRWYDSAPPLARGCALLRRSFPPSSPSRLNNALSILKGGWLRAEGSV